MTGHAACPAQMTGLNNVWLIEDAPGDVRLVLAGRTASPGGRAHRATSGRAVAHRRRHDGRECAVLGSDLLGNLLQNALKYSVRAAVTQIHFGMITSQSAAPTPDQQVFFVQDNGIGFDKAAAGKLFAPFHRLPSAAGFAGSAIGLVTCGAWLSATAAGPGPTARRAWDRPSIFPSATCR